MFATGGTGTITATFVAKAGQLVTAVRAVWRLVTDQAALDTGTNHTLELERLCTRATRLVGIVDAVILFIAGELLSYTPIIGTPEEARRAGAHRAEFQQFIRSVQTVGYSVAGGLVGDANNRILAGHPGTLKLIRGTILRCCGATFPVREQAPTSPTLALNTAAAAGGRVSCADVLTAAVEDGTARGGAAILPVIHRDNAHGAEDTALQHGSVLAGIFVHSDDAVEDPVGEEKIVAEESDGEGVLQKAFNNHRATATA